ncbi:phosphate ABC transporter substrate-binding protein PstS family protein [Clostridium lundense]|uniref:phosphate ABC transporter substrate-binding protein PstS family protein n=1 Tax=Clostridium lundense TaxID=319475 RepID=UPI000489DD9F|nr:phosphate ABC transporter substrate-binding protein PstS family protein [Clostridium lundense]
MKRKSLKAIITALAITMTTGVFVGCGAGEKKEPAKQEGKISGTITSVGSTALQPLVEQVAKNFKEKNPSATINVQGGGSGAGLNQVAEGTVQIGNSDVTAESKLKNAEIVKQLVDHKVCAIGFAMVTHKDVKVDSLTKEQIQGIFTGKYTNWNQVGAKESLPINLINRPKSSGTRAAFKDTVMNKIDEKEGLGTTQDSSGSVEKTVASTPGSISYLALSYLTAEKRQNLKVLKIEGVEGTKENIVAKKYPFWSFEHMYTKGEPTGVTKAFLDYMVSDENKSVIEKLGYIPVTDIK